MVIHHIQSRYRYSSRTSDISQYLSYCKVCYREIKRNHVHKAKDCKRCLRWDILSNIKLSSTDSSKDYPLDLVSRENKLEPKKLSWESLKEAVTLTTDNLVAGKWTKINATLYLLSCCINKMGIDKVLTHSDNIKALTYLNVCEVNESDKAYIESMTLNDPAKFEQWKGGPYWKGIVKFDAFIDVIIHLLFWELLKVLKR